jgi:hypothetical protein
VVQEPIRVLSNGVGLSFEMTPQDAKNLAFRDYSNAGVKYIGVWRLENVSSNEFWNMKQIIFTPISDQVYSFSADRFYKKNEFRSEPECMEDYRLLINKIKTQYPTLRDVTIYSNNMPKDYRTTTLCEGEKKYRYLPTGSGIGRCIRLYCAVQVWGDEQVIGGSMLGISYKDLEKSSLFEEEKKEYIERNQDIMLKKRGLSTDQL